MIDRLRQRLAFLKQIHASIRGARTEVTVDWDHAHQNKKRPSPGAPRHEVNGFVIRAIRGSFRGSLDLHVHAASFTPAHRVQVEPAGASVTADGTPIVRAADIAFADAKGRQKPFHRSGLPAFVDTADWFHVPCMDTATTKRLSER